MQFSDHVDLEIIKTGLSWLTVCLGWLVGWRIIARWDLMKKRQELDIAIATQFHKLYGEFKEVSRLWRAFSFRGHRSKPLTFPDTTRLDLLKRAAAAEGGVEAIIVKLVAERVLDGENIKTLGLFRQAYQKLREAIRDGGPLEWTRDKPEYTLYNDLASKTACIISSNKIKKCKSAKAPQMLRRITAIEPKEWDDALNLIVLQTKGKGVS